MPFEGMGRLASLAEGQLQDRILKRNGVSRLPRGTRVGLHLPADCTRTHLQLFQLTGNSLATSIVRNLQGFELQQIGRGLEI